MTVVGIRAASKLSQTDLLRELEPVVEENLNRHLKVAKEWMPHEYVPWSAGPRLRRRARRRAWALEQSQLSDDRPHRADRQPAHRGQPAELPPRDRRALRPRRRLGHLGATAGPPRRAGTRIAIRDYLLVTRGVDPVELERARMDAHGRPASTPATTTAAATSCAYVSFQELATRVSHRNTGKVTDDPIAEQLLARIAKDENLHMIFYRNLVGAALELAPEPDDAGDHRRGRRASRCPGTTIAGLPPQVGADRQGRHLRPAHPPRRRARAGAAAVGRLRARGPRRRRRGGPRRAGRRSSTSSTRRRRGSRRSGSPTTTSWPPAATSSSASSPPLDRSLDAEVDRLGTPVRAASRSTSGPGTCDRTVGPQPLASDQRRTTDTSATNRTPLPAAHRAAVALQRVVQQRGDRVGLAARVRAPAARRAGTARPRRRGGRAGAHRHRPHLEQLRGRALHDGVAREPAAGRRRRAGPPARPAATSGPADRRTCGRRDRQPPTRARPAGRPSPPGRPAPARAAPRRPRRRSARTSRRAPRPSRSAGRPPAGRPPARTGRRRRSPAPARRRRRPRPAPAARSGRGRRARAACPGSAATAGRSSAGRLCSPADAVIRPAAPSQPVQLPRSRPSGPTSRSSQPKP